MILGQHVASLKTSSLTLQCCLECMAVRIDPTIFTLPKLNRDYGFLRIERYVNPYTGDVVIPDVPTEEDDNTTWTTKYDLDLL